MSFVSFVVLLSLPAGLHGNHLIEAALRYAACPIHSFTYNNIHMCVCYYRVHDFWPLRESWLTAEVGPRGQEMGAEGWVRHLFAITRVTNFHLCLSLLAELLPCPDHGQSHGFCSWHLPGRLDSTFVMTPLLVLEAVYVLQRFILNCSFPYCIYLENDSSL